MRNGGEWTEGKYRQFISGALRKLSVRWPPRHTALARARVDRGLYLCAHCRKVGPDKITIRGKARRVPNAVVDHIDPVVDPMDGFTDWNTFVARLFCEADELQVLCHACHAFKTKQEAADRARGRRRRA